jgi:acetoin utilization deacetylase AcuC-like enzyme
MKIVYSDKHAVHDPQTFFVRGVKQRSTEQPERATRLLVAAKDAGHEVIAAQVHGIGPVASVHTPEYLDFLQIAARDWAKLPSASAEVMPNVHPARTPATYPKALVGRAGWHQADLACPIGPGTWDAALAASDIAVTAADLVRDGARESYALCRPPGHHAFADVAGGFCFINNSAVAAQVLRSQAARVAILDVDLHHGNGTQGIFYARPDVLTVSLHADPVRFYPFFWGHADERGEGPGLGYNLNLPLPRKSGDEIFLETLEVAFRRIRAFAPDALVVALGLDAFEGDPFGGLSVTTPGFSRIAQAIAKLGLPTTIVQEGGYLCDALGDNLTAFLTGFGGKAR